MRDPRQATEEAIHCAVVDLLRVKASPFLIWFHPANGEERAPAVAAKLKRMGVVPGVADLALTLPDGRSAFMEFKAAKGRQSPEQRAWEARCRDIGTPYALVRSVDEADAVLASWDALKVTVRRAA